MLAATSENARISIPLARRTFNRSALIFARPLSAIPYESSKNVIAEFVNASPPSTTRRNFSRAADGWLRRSATMVSVSSM